MSAFATVTVKLEIDEQRVRDLLCSAYEGGSNYWCRVKEKKLTPEAEVALAALAEERAATQDDVYGHDFPFIPGCDVILEDVSEEADDSPWTLNRDKLIKGLQVMAEKCPRHFSAFMDENDDAETGDVYLQCCLFGEIVFG